MQERQIIQQSQRCTETRAEVRREVKTTGEADKVRSGVNPGMNPRCGCGPRCEPHRAAHTHTHTLSLSGSDHLLRIVSFPTTRSSAAAPSRSKRRGEVRGRSALQLSAAQRKERRDLWSAAGTSTGGAGPTAHNSLFPLVPLLSQPYPVIMCSRSP